LTEINNDDFIEDNVEFDNDLLQAEADIKAGKKSNNVKACSSMIDTMNLP